MNAARNSAGLERLVAVLAAAAAVMFGLQVFSANKADVDLWGNVGFVGAPPWTAGFHRANTFSFTEPDHPWINHEWGAQYAFGLAFRTFGNRGLLALKVLLGFAVIGLMHASMRRDGLSGPLRFLLVLLVVSTMGYGFGVRPHHFTYLGVALVLYVLRWHGTRRVPMLLLLPAAGLLWANLHGAFFTGLILLLLWSAMEAGRRARGDAAAAPLLPALAAALFLAASFVNPYGADLWTFIIRNAGAPRTYLSEWAPLNPVRDFYSHVDFMALAAVSAAAAWRGRRALRAPWALFLAVAFVAAVALRRNIPLFALVAGFALPPALEAAAAAPVARLWSRFPRALAAGLLAAAILLSARFAWRFDKQAPLEIEIPSDRFPVATMAFMQSAGIRGNAIVFFDWAEYAIWKLYPSCRVFLDGRFLDAYSPRTVEDFLQFIYGGPRWREVLERYPADIVLVHEGNPVAACMRELPDWAEVDATDPARLFLKKSAHADLIAALADGRLRPPAPPPPIFP